MRIAHAFTMAVAGAALALGCPALADIKDGVDAWARGDYAAAVAQWREPAEKGDPDAQFNMAQAYRLGRGVPQDERQAEVLYAKAAAQGHLKAADNYGLLLFQSGRHEEAMPYIRGAAERGDPRAQYLVGIAHFNGDLVPKDWVRAYALLTLANSAGLPQASEALKQMDEYIPLAQRQQAQSLAQEIKHDSDAVRARQLAAVDLATGPRSAPASPPPTKRAGSITEAQAAIAEAGRVTGTQSPAQAGADYARPPVAAAPPASPTAERRPPPAPAPKPTPVPARTVPASASADGPWRVQLGAFSVAGNADRLWRNVSGMPALAGKHKIVEPAGRLSKLLVGGFASQDAAQQACNALKASGHDCLVTR